MPTGQVVSQKQLRDRAYSHKRHQQRCATMRLFGIDPKEAWKWRQSTPGTVSHNQWLKWASRNEPVAT